MSYGKNKISLNIYTFHKQENDLTKEIRGNQNGAISIPKFLGSTSPPKW
jgi:hypothetical protein